MVGFLRLVRKDLEAIRWSTGIIMGAVLGLLVFLRFKLAAGWSEQLVSVWMTIPLMFLPFWLLWQSFQGLRTEWRDDTIYTLLSLPVPGWQVTLAKLTTVIVEYTLLAGVIVFGNLILNPLVKGFAAEFPVMWLIRNGLLIYLTLLGHIAFFVVLIQLAFVVSKMVGRVQALVALWALFLSLWLTTRVGELLAPAFRWLPPIPLHRVFKLEEIGRGAVTANIALAPQVGRWLLAFALFCLTGYLLENFVEAN
ncbi:MAG TPA: hypothetical protein GX528_01660 [Firmicutes bacterium]|nr:hypothetical protein [Bacillota bacterium]